MNSATLSRDSYLRVPLLFRRMSRVSIYFPLFFFYFLFLFFENFSGYLHPGFFSTSNFPFSSLKSL